MDDLRVIAAWLASEIRALFGWLRAPGLAAALLGGLFMWSLAYQATPEQILHIGGDRETRSRNHDAPYLSGFHASEPSSSGDRSWWESGVPPYRWASDSAEIVLPGVGGDLWEIAIAASSGRPDGSAVTSRWQIGEGAPVTMTVAARPQLYRLIGRTSGGDLHIALATPRLDAPGDPRPLGLVVSQIRVAPLGSPALRLPAPRQLGLLAASLLLWYGLARRLRLPPRPALALTLGAALLLALILLERRLALTVFTPALAWLSAICYLLVVALAPLFSQAARWLNINATPTEQHAALGTIVGAFGLRMGGLLHPHALFSDLELNINNLAAFIRGTTYLIEGLPCEAGGGDAPYPPAQYLVLAPLRLLVGDNRQHQAWLIQGANALLESCSAGLIWLLLRRLGLGQRAALSGAALYITAPPILRSFSVGEFANLFAQSLLVPLLLFLVVGTPRARRWPAAALGGLLLLTMLLSHTGVTLSVMALLAAWLPIWWFSQPSHARAWPIAAAGGAALLLAVLLFYSSYTDLFQERRAMAAAQAAAPGGQRCPPGIPLGVKLIGTARSALGPSGPLSPLLMLTGGCGVLWLWKRGALRIDLALLACWVGTLLSLGTLLTIDQPVRWQPFLFPALCLGAGPLLAAWMRRGRASLLLALAILGYLIWRGLELWIWQIVHYFH